MVPERLQAVIGELAAPELLVAGSALVEVPPGRSAQLFAFSGEGLLQADAQPLGRTDDLVACNLQQPAARAPALQ